MKDYTTICSSAPSEVLALIGLQRDRVLARSRRIVSDNLAVLDDLFRRRADRLSWIHPRGGSIAFPRHLDATPIDDFAARLVEEEGVLLLPGSRIPGIPATTSGSASAARACRRARDPARGHYLDRSTP